MGRLVFCGPLLWYYLFECPSPWWYTVASSRQSSAAWRCRDLYAPGGLPDSTKSTVECLTLPRGAPVQSKTCDTCRRRADRDHFGARSILGSSIGRDTAGSADRCSSWMWTLCAALASPWKHPSSYPSCTTCRETWRQLLRSARLPWRARRGSWARICLEQTFGSWRGCLSWGRESRWKGRQYWTRRGIGRCGSKRWSFSASLGSGSSCSTRHAHSPLSSSPSPHNRSYILRTSRFGWRKRSCCRSSLGSGIFWSLCKTIDQCLGIYEFYTAYYADSFSSYGKHSDWNSLFKASCAL